MSHTNSTANYSLPQFVGSDKPAWLTDVNGAMTSIDTQMKANADSASTANASATTANSNIGTLANLNTTAKTNIVSAVNEVNTNLGAVSGVASSASGTANTAKNTADALEAYITLTDFNNISSSYTTSGLSVTSANVQCATNATGSVGKIYGSFEFQVTSTSGGSITFDTAMRPSAPLTINGAMFVTRYDTNIGVRVFNYSYTIAMDGKVTIALPASFYNLTGSVNLMACLLFLKDFGDTPIQP